MIYHISIAANQPLRVAQVLAELWQGQVTPFPNHAGSYVVLTFDPHGTLIEVLPRGTELTPGTGKEGAQFSQNPYSSSYGAVHAAISVPTSEAQIMAIAAREGWRAVRCNRAEYFEVIEFWVENQLLLELLPSTLAAQYLSFMQPQTLQQVLATVAEAT